MYRYGREKILLIYGQLNQLIKFIKSLFINRYSNKSTFFFHFKKPRLVKYFKVMRNRWLREACNFFCLAASHTFISGYFFKYP